MRGHKILALLTFRNTIIALILGAGIMSTILFVGLVLVLWRGGWAAVTQPLVIDFLGKGLLAMAGLMGAAMLGLLLAGPLARLKIGNSTCDVEIEGDEK